MDEDHPGIRFGMQPLFLLAGDVKKAASNTACQYCCAEPHIDQGDGHCAEHQADEQDGDTPINKFALEAFEYKGLLKPLVNSEMLSHQDKPKKALTINAETTRKTQLPPQPIISLFIS